MTRFLAVLATLLITSAVLAACGGGDGGAAAARERLEQLQPIESAEVSTRLRIDLDDAPADLGTPLELRLDGPLKSNGPDRLPSLDWSITFAGFGERFSTRLVSTGSDVFVRLGGVDFALGQEAVGRLNAQLAAQQGRQHARPGGALGLDPLAAVASIAEQGEQEVGGAQTTRYSGQLDLDRALDQVGGLLRTISAQGEAFGQPIPPLRLGPEQRRTLAEAYGDPEFEIDVAQDDTVRRILVRLPFTRPVNAEAEAAGITGGRITYEATYTNVGEDPVISPPTQAEPFSEFASELRRLLDAEQGAEG